jgi:hypothetical protein
MVWLHLTLPMSLLSMMIVIAIAGGLTHCDVFSGVCGAIDDLTEKKT